MRVVVVVIDLAQFLARNAHHVGKVVVAGGDGEFVRMQDAGPGEAVDGVDVESAVRAGDTLYALILTDVEFVEGRDLAVVLQRLVAGWLGVGARKRGGADLEQLRCRTGE